MKRFSSLMFLFALLGHPGAAKGVEARSAFVAPAACSGSADCGRAASLHDRLRSVRVAPGGPVEITDGTLDLLAKAGYNTLFLSDMKGSDGTKATRVPAETVQRWLMLARRHGFSVIVFSAFVESLPATETNGGSGDAVSRPTGQAVAMRTPFAGRSRSSAAPPHRDAARALDSPPPAPRLRYLSTEEVLANLRPWQEYNEGEVIAITPLGDDPFYLAIPAEKQLEWSRLAHIAAPGIPTLGLIGEFALSLPIEEARRYWAPAAFSSMALIMYPYNLGYLWGHPLNHVTSADPDADLTQYVHDYVREQYSRFLCALDPTQTVIPVIQTFSYQGEDAGIVPRSRDITLQAQLIHDEMQVTLGQSDNYSMGYFYLGADPSTPTNLKGIDDMPGWPETVLQENTLIEQQFRLKIPAEGGHRHGDR